MSESSLYGLKVGDRVLVFESFRSQPKAGQDGTVVKVGRKLITVNYGYHESVFRLEGGQANDDYGHTWIETVEQAAENLRRGDLKERLRSGGVELRQGHEFTTETLEALVDVLDRAALGVCVDQPEKD